MIKGQWSPGGSSSQYNSTLTLTLTGDRFVLRRFGEDVPEQEGAANMLTFSDRVGNIPRHITFADGSVFVTQSNDEVDEWLVKSSHPAGRMSLFHRMESNWGYVVLGVLVTASVVFATFRWGVPAMSKQVAFALPAETNTFLAGKTLEVLDELVFEPSELSNAEQRQQRDHFQNDIASMHPGDIPYRLHFRKMPSPFGGEGSIPNAMALPSGDIIVTDALINALVDQKKIDAILLHEMGHVVNRHSLRQVLQSSSVMVLILMTTGEVSVAEDIVAALPGFMLQSHYSREFELEADKFAFELLLENGRDPADFALALEGITPDEDEVLDSGKALNWLGKYLSTHPATPERAAQAREYSELAQ